MYERILWDSWRKLDASSLYWQLQDSFILARAWHLDHGSKLEQGLMVTARAGALILRGNATMAQL